MSATTRSVFGVEALHRLTPELLAPILNPELHSARRNVIFKRDINRRLDLAEDHGMEVLE